MAYMTYAQIKAEIKLLSKRGDIDDKIDIAIRNTTVRAHRMDFWPRDMLEVAITSVTDETEFDVICTSALTRFRAVKYARYYDNTTTPATRGRMLEKISPEDVLDEYDTERLDRYYLSGDTLKFRLQYPSYGIEIGYFTSPLVYPVASYTSWIADQLPDLIIQGSLAYLYNLLGKQEEARSINAMVGFETPRGGTAGPTMIDQLRAYALLEDAH